MLLGSLGASLLGNLSRAKGIMRAGKATIRAGPNFKLEHSKNILKIS